jgi:hypothetical protein
MDGTEGTALGTFSWPNTLIMACWTVSYPGAGLIRANSTMVGYTTADPTITIPEIRANSGDKLVTFVIAAVGGGSASVGTIGAVYGETRRFSNTQAGGTSKRQLAVSDEVLGSTGATGTRTCAITGQFASNFSDAGFMVALGVSAPVTSSESMQMNIY